MLRAIGIVACAAISLQGTLWASGPDDERPEIKGGIAGKVVKVDAEKGTLTIAREDGRERTFAVTNDTTIVGPRGGLVHRRLRDPRFHKGLSVTVVASGEAATELHLGFDRKGRRETAASTEDNAPATETRRTTRFRGTLGSRSGEAKSEESDADDSDFPGKVKSVDATRRLLVVTLLNGKNKSFLLSRDVKVIINGRASRQGLADRMIKPGLPVTVVTEEGGHKVKEVKVTPAVSRRVRDAS